MPSLKKTIFKNGQAPYLSDITLNNLQDDIATAIKECRTFIIISTGTTITNDYSIELPLKYRVGDNSLELYWNGTKLIKATDVSDGHYKEYGENENLSNIIKMHRTEENGDYILTNDLVLEIIVRGVEQNENTK